MLGTTTTKVTKYIHKQNTNTTKSQHISNKHKQNQDTNTTETQMAFHKCLHLPTKQLKNIHFGRVFVATPLLEECEDDTHTPEMGIWEFLETSEISELDCRGQNTLHWGVLYIIGKL
jgi:hypothetical protein